MFDFGVRMGSGIFTLVWPHADGQTSKSRTPISSHPVVALARQMLVSGSANSMMRSADPAVVVLLMQFQQGLRSRQCKTAGIHGGNCECVQACR